MNPSGAGNESRAAFSIPEEKGPVRRWFEIRFQALIRFIFRFPWTVLILTAALSVFLSLGLGRLTIDTSTKSLLYDDDPTVLTYNRFVDQFGRGDLMVIGLEPERIFDLDFLVKLRGLHRALEERVPYLAEVTSLINARETRGQGERLIVGQLLESWPGSQKELAEIRRRALANPLYRNLLLSPDEKMTALLIRLETYSPSGPAETQVGEALSGFEDRAGGGGGQRPELSEAENQAAVEEVQKVMAEMAWPGVRMTLAGGPVVSETLKRRMIQDIVILLQISVVVMALCLLVMFRRLSGVILPLLVVGVSLASILGLMGYAKVALKIPLMILPSFLACVGVGASVHVLALFYRQYDAGADKEEAMKRALGHSGLAITMTSLTTAAGLASFITAEIAPVASLGVFASMGVMLALVYTVILLPGLAAVLPLRRRPVRREGAGSPRFDRFLDRVTDLATGRPWSILLVSLALIVFSLVGVSRLKFSHDVLAWLGESMPVRQATERIDRILRGTVVLEIVLDTGRKNGLHDPELLKRLDGLARELEGARWGDLFVGKTTSLVDVIKEIHQALNENRPEFHRLPDSAGLVAQELLLFESGGLEDLEELVDHDYRLARFNLKVPWRDTLEYVPFLTDVEARFRSALGDRAEITVTGMMALFSRSFFGAIHSAARSYLVAFSVITVLMALLIGRVKLGLVSMLPNLTPILITAGLMGWFRWPLDMSTMLVFSVAIGLAVDDTVHFMHIFRRYFDQTGVAEDSVRSTLHTAGRAMVVTSLVLTCGGVIFMFASIKAVFYFGLLTALATVLALLADFLMSPALMVLLHRRKEESEGVGLLSSRESPG